MKLVTFFTVAVFSTASFAVAADVNFDVNMKTKQGNTETNLSIGNKPKPAPTTVIVKEKTVVIKESAGREDREHYDNGKKKGHYKDKYKKHKKHDKHDKRDNGEDEHGRHHRD